MRVVVQCLRDDGSTLCAEFADFPDDVFRGPDKRQDYHCGYVQQLASRVFTDAQRVLTREHERQS